MSEFEQADAEFHVLAVGLLVGGQLLAHRDQLAVPLGFELGVDLAVDGAVELVHVELAQAVHDGRLLRLEGRHHLLVVRLLVALALLEREPERLGEAFVELKCLEDLAELLGDRLLADVLPLALALVAGAVVVDVLAFLDLGRHRAAAVAAGDEPSERERAVHVRAAPAPFHDRLHLVEQLLGDERRVVPLDQPVLPAEPTVVERVGQHFVDTGLGRRARRGATRHESLFARHLEQIGERVVPRAVQLEQAADDGRLFGIDVDVPRDRVVEVANRRAHRVVALARFLVEALLDLLGEVVHVVLRHQHLDAVDELLMRAGVPRQDRVLLVEMHDEVLLLHEVVERHPVLQVAVEPVCLLDDDDAAGLGLPEEAAHLLELAPAGLLRRLDVRELADELEAVRQRVGPGGIDLRRDGEAFLLLLRADAHVEDRLATIEPSISLGWLPTAAGSHGRPSSHAQTGVRA